MPITDHVDAVPRGVVDDRLGGIAVGGLALDPGQALVLRPVLGMIEGDALADRVVDRRRDVSGCAPPWPKQCSSAI